MATKSGKIKVIDFDGTWENNGRTLSRYIVHFETGEQYKFNAVGDFKKNVGDVIEFEVINEQYKNAKLVQTFTPQGGGAKFGGKSPEQQASIERQSMLKAAVDFHSGSGASEEQVINTARKFLNFVNNG